MFRYIGIVSAPQLKDIFACRVVTIKFNIRTISL